MSWDTQRSGAGPVDSELVSLDAAELARRIHAREVSSVEVTRAHLERIEAVDGPAESGVHAFLHLDADGALAAAGAADRAIADGGPVSPLAGVPIALKDNLTTTDMPTTCASRILEGWRPPYDATVVTRLRAAGLVPLGKTNLDEFAMGSSTENSAFGPSRNPWDLTRIPGGSGGGSSSAVAAGESPLALGSDTGGSIRQPGAVTGTVGVKPTYGTVSRYGLVAFSSSLDQIGPCARSVLDAALLHEVIGGKDANDQTSVSAPLPPVVEAAQAGARGDLAGVRVGVVSEFSGEGYHSGVLAAFTDAVRVLGELGADVVEVSCPSFAYALPAYYLIAPSEASSNLARFDAMRYGLRVGDDGEHAADEVMSLTREAGFGAEVKRRIMIGTHALSAGSYDALYGKAQKARTLIVRDFTAAFETCDVLVSPTTPTTAFAIGERSDDPLAMYLADLCTIPSNLAGNAALSVPCGRSADDGLPVGLQVMAPALADDRAYRVAAAYEAATAGSAAGPRIPELRALETSR
ncbi:glutamyl-tRNA(Gln) amidotransferase subunit A [Actinomycetospora sp. NBRC 106375]|uniref:Asp-tRNA(Asn)/Glu-tRNA(Gln) amidotransferase subunit GatA n=1 Tax=Actinomycetospora sp. NBRC 106375 TaxID=3032207 RepID=UPI0024A0CA5F|nr:Asp-tRNA(Asn)/Glu-tRNA(Gln) amidotransferase subunit GatA [Actinomycetospora sp. NBRC 106375]GLZ47899.1 glutamyl-tRNA(Gln) amidotransferase subunit A [Actinomycetospora sp. NBRC 106375]